MQDPRVKEINEVSFTSITIILNKIKGILIQIGFLGPFEDHQHLLLVPFERGCTI